MAVDNINNIKGEIGDMKSKLLLPVKQIGFNRQDIGLGVKEGGRKGKLCQCIAMGS